MLEILIACSPTIDGVASFCPDPADPPPVCLAFDCVKDPKEPMVVDNKKFPLDPIKNVYVDHNSIKIPIWRHDWK